LKGSGDASCFGAFIMFFIEELLKQRSRYALSARIHKAEILKPFFEQLNIFCNAPYSPFLIPLKSYLDVGKEDFERNSLKTLSILLKKIIRSAQEIDDSMLNAFFLHSVSFLEDCLSFKPIF